MVPSYRTPDARAERTPAGEYESPDESATRRALYLEALERLRDPDLRRVRHEERGTTQTTTMLVVLAWSAVLLLVFVR
jgi:hypothetical protein